jgi:hypothetical protein
MSSADVPLWVPIVVGVLGFGGVLGAQLVAGWREDRRWQRELQREDLRWQRERERLREERRYAGREEAYGRMIGLLEAWQWVMHPAKERMIKAGADELDEAMRRELSNIRDQAREALGPMNLHAPADIRRLMRDAVLSKVRLTRALIGEDRAMDRAAMAELYEQGLQHYYAMRTAMRRDLGVDEPV